MQSLKNLNNKNLSLTFTIFKIKIKCSKSQCYNLNSIFSVINYKANSFYVIFMLLLDSS